MEEQAVGSSRMDGLGLANEPVCRGVIEYGSQKANHGRSANSFLNIPPHDLRHTWASWHYCLHKDLLKLQGEGGWEGITVVTRYAKSMPDIYEAEIIAFLDGDFARFL